MRPYKLEHRWVDLDRILGMSEPRLHCDEARMELTLAFLDKPVILEFILNEQEQEEFRTCEKPYDLESRPIYRARVMGTFERILAEWKDHTPRCLLCQEKFKFDAGSFIPSCKCYSELMK